MDLRPLARTAPKPARALTLLGALLLALAAPRVYAQVRIGVVDIRRAVAETAEGRAAFDAMKIRYDDRQRDLDRRTKIIETLKRRIEHPTAPIPQARLERMAAQYQQQVGELQQYGQQYTQELQTIESELTKTILTKIQPIVRQIGQTDNFQVIVDEQVVHFAPSHLNLTDRVIQAYNQQFPLRGPIQLPDAGAIVQPPSRAGVDAGAAVEPPETDPVVAPTPAAGDAGRGALPGVFFRRDAGAR